MQHDKPPKDVFEAWGKDYHADGMEAEHWPRVKRIFERIKASNGNYLEIGVGNGYGLAHMAANQFAQGQCFGLDLSSTMVERARARSEGLANVSVETADFLARDFGEGRFDTIFSMEVFYYFDDIQRGIDKAVSLLNPGGELWVAVNYYHENASSEDWPERLGTAMQRWSAADYVTGFERAGLGSVQQLMIDTPLPEDSPHGDAPTLCTWGRRP